MNSTSPFAKINIIDIKKTAIHFLIIAAVSFALYLIDQVVPQINFTGQWAILTPIISSLAALAQRYLTNYQAQQNNTVASAKDQV